MVQNSNEGYLLLQEGHYHYKRVEFELSRITPLYNVIYNIPES